MSSLPTVECYFGAGPAKLPAEVLEEAKATLLNYPYRGLSILEMSHRDKQFDKILDNSILCLRKLMNIPSHYKIFFMQGGGTAQFAACPLNLLGNISVEEAKKKRPGYIVTGAWSQKAIAEAKKYCNPFVIVDSKQPDGSYSSIHTPEHWEWQTELPPYVYYCENETIHGIEFSQPPVLPATYQGKVPLVGDLSSNFLSRPVDVTKYDVIFAGAQKNSGIAGLTTVIIREDLLNRALSITPTILHYKSISDGNSVLNTPPTFGIHVAGLVFEWLVKQGGLEAIGKKKMKKRANYSMNLLIPARFLSAKWQKVQGHE